MAAISGGTGAGIVDCFVSDEENSRASAQDGARLVRDENVSVDDSRA
jgi:hypothetical protein